MLARAYEHHRQRLESLRQRMTNTHHIRIEASICPICLADLPPFSVAPASTAPASSSSSVDATLSTAPAIETNAAGHVRPGVTVLRCGHQFHTPVQSSLEYWLSESEHLLMGCAMDLGGNSASVIGCVPKTSARSVACHDQTRTLRTILHLPLRLPLPITIAATQVLPLFIHPQYLL